MELSRGPSRQLIRLVAGAVALVLTLPVPAHGQSPSHQERMQAAKLGGEAIDLYAAGDYAAALEKFEQAEQIVPAPTIKLRIARCLDQLDRMQEAAEKYRQVIEAELPHWAPKVHRDAREKAVPELAALLEQIPTLEISLRGPGADIATVELDGIELGADELREQHAVDPGSHVVVARVGEQAARRSVTARRGEHLVVKLRLEGADEPEADDADTAEPAPAGAWMPTAAWVGIGVGAAGFVLGTAAGIAVLDEEAELLDRCPDRQCPPEVHDDARSFDGLRAASTAGFAIGTVALAAGVTLLLWPIDETEPSNDDADERAEPSEEAQLVPYLAPAAVGLAGRF